MSLNSNNETKILTAVVMLFPDVSLMVFFEFEVALLETAHKIKKVEKVNEKSVLALKNTFRWLLKMNHMKQL